MKKIILICLLVVLFIVSCDSQTQQTNVQNSNQNEVVSQQASIPETTPPFVGTSSIIIKNFAFAPDILTVKASSTVIWTNQDSAPHIILFDSFESDTLSNGGSYEHKFDTFGTYDYSCKIHPSMKGQIIVK